VRLIVFVYILLRNCFIIQVTKGGIEEKIKGTRRRGRRLKQILVDLKGTVRYWNLKEAVLDRSLWGSRFGRAMDLL
jgi:hypothetical protein